MDPRLYSVRVCVCSCLREEFRQAALELSYANEDLQSAEAELKTLRRVDRDA